MSEFFKMIGSAFLGGLIALYLPFFRRLIWGPKLILSFGRQIRGCVPKTPIQIKVSEGEVINIIDTVGYYVRVMVKNIKYAVAKDCRAFLVNIEKKGEDNLYHPTVYFDSIQVQWANRSGQGFQGIDLPRGINQFIDIISTIKDHPNIEPKIELMPFMYRELFSEIGTFRYTIQVSGNEFKPEYIKIIIKWKGIWDDFDVDIDRESCLEGASNFSIDILSKLPFINFFLRLFRNYANSLKK